MGLDGGTAFAASQNAGIGEIADDTPDTGVVPLLARPGPIALVVQVAGDPLGPVALTHVLVKDNPYHGGLGLVDGQIKDFMLALVDPPAFYEVVAVGGVAALVVPVLHHLAQARPGADGGLFTFTVGLPKPYVVGELVGVIVKPLLTLLGAPHPDAVLDKPFHHKGRFIRDAANAVKHEHKQNIKLALLGVFLDNLHLVPVFRPYLVAGNAVLLFLVNNRPALFLREAVAGFTLHGDVRLVFIVVIHLLVGGNSV